MRIRHDVTRDNANIIAKNRDRIGERKGTKKKEWRERGKNQRGKGEKEEKDNKKKNRKKEKHAPFYTPVFLNLPMEKQSV